MPGEAYLVYNRRRSIKVDRKKLANSCFYFQRLLEGPFKESKQTCIDINLGNMFSFEAFDCIVRYANDGIFIKDPEKHNVYIQAIQLAILWSYDEFVEIMESHFIEQISLETMTDFHGLAVRHKFHLSRLEEECIKFSKSLTTGSVLRAWPRCPIPGHGPHHYSSCPKELDDNDWDRTD